jgi:nucleoside-diphosphate-sugar epimerase
MVLPPVSETCFTKDFPKGTKIVVTGAGGFIGSHLAKRLKEEGHYVRAVDWKENEYMKEDTFCNEFLNLDLRWPDNCAKAVEGMEWCFNLAVRNRLPHLAHRLLTTGCLCLLTCAHE